jgi:hypothetical protein
MRVQDWERDILNRQRNIVFPDTMLNEVRFYRHIIRFKTRLNPVQRAGVLLMGAFALLSGLLFLLDAIVTARDGEQWLAGLLAAVPASGYLFFGSLFVHRGLTATSTPQTPRWWLKQRSRRP